MIHATTVIAVRHRGGVAMAGDGQVSFNNMVLKHGARKVRRIHHDRVLAGFAGAAADAFSLFTKFEAKLEEFRGNLSRAAVELAKDWRSDRVLRRLEAPLAGGHPGPSLIVSRPPDPPPPPPPRPRGAGGPPSRARGPPPADRACRGHAHLEQPTHDPTRPRGA